MHTAINAYNGEAHQYESREEAQTFCTLSNRTSARAEWYYQQGHKDAVVAEWQANEREEEEYESLRDRADTREWNESNMV